jgi:SAM-dependent methyltransferase
MDTSAMDPYGQSLLDYFRGDHSAGVLIHRDDGLTDELPASIFFRKPEDFSPLERAALALCRGAVLDVGAGTGCHSLALQERGIDVFAIDISPLAIEILSSRGVRQYQLADVFKLQHEPFDTLLMMMHGIGMVGDLPGLDRYLQHARTLLKPDGQLLFDSLDVRCTDNPRHLAYQEANRQAGRYFGQIRMCFEYKWQTGAFFNWLHVDPQTLAEHAQRSGWRCQVTWQGDDGNYLAQLTLSKPA